MCTAMTAQSPQGTTYFGRTMDFSYPLAPELYTVPRGFQWNNLLHTHRIRSQYSFMGIGQDLSPIILADGVNEKGFAAAVLYFPGAQYDSISSAGGKMPIAALELVSFLLATSSCVEQAAAILRTICIVGVQDTITGTIAPLHWMIADATGRCLVIEKTAAGLQLLENPIGVLTNSPDFPWQMTNLRNYTHISPQQTSRQQWGSLQLPPFGQGAGSLGLPGDYTPPSRFVRTAYQKSHIPLPDHQAQAINTCFHIMEAVTITKGAVITERNTADYTQYTAFIDLSAREYFFKTYSHSAIATAKLCPSTGDQLIFLGKLDDRPITFERWENKSHA